MATTETVARPTWACRKCSRVTGDASLCAISDLVTTVELRLCVDCRRALRLDPLVIVEEISP